jgi:hypothetical protein
VDAAHRFHQALVERGVVGEILRQTVGIIHGTKCNDGELAFFSGGPLYSGAGCFNWGIT